MAKSFLTDIQLNNNVLLNAKIQAWGSTPTGTTNPTGTGTAVTGQISTYLGALYIFNGTAWVAVGSAGTVTGVTGTSPVVSSGGTTPAISLASGYGDTLNPYASKTANYILAAPNGSSGAPTFRAIVAADIPTLNQSTTGSAATLTTPRAINGVNFDGSAAITVTAAAGTLTGSTLNSGVTASSLTSVGTLANLTVTNTITGSVSGNAGTATTLATARTINGTSFDGSANITVTAAAGTLTGATLNSGVTASSLTSVGSLNGLTIASTQTVSMGSNRVTNVGTPTAASDAATKAYVDNVSTGVNIHDAVVAATTGTIAGVYAAGSTTANPPGDGGTGVGATITYSATGVVTLDTSVTLAAGDRVLVKDGVTAAAGASSIANGVYVVTTAGAVGTAAILTRATDADNSHFGDLSAGDLVYVIGGSTHGGDQFVQTTKGTATQGTGSDTTYSVKIGTDAISYTQFSGAGAVPNATTTTVGIASFPAAQFSVASGAVQIDNLSGNLITSGTVADGRIASALTGKTYNKVTITAPTTGSVLTIADTKTFVVNSSLTLAGTDATTMTFPGTSATIARTDSAQTFTGVQTFTSPAVATSLTTASSTFNLLPSVQTATVADVVSTLSIGAGTHSTGTRTITIGTTSGASGAGQTINLGANTQTTATNIINIGGSTSTTTTITGTVLLPTVANSTAGFVKTATDGTLSRSATIANSEMATSTSTATATAAAATGNVTNARKAIGVGIGTGTAMVVNHGLGQWVTAQLYDTSGNQVEVDVLNASTSGGTTTFTFSSSQTLTGFQYVIVG